MYLFNLGCREVAVSDTLTVMSFNLLRAFNEQCGSLWKDRVSGVQHIVRTYNPDILGTQEGCALHYVTYFHLPNVTRYPIAVYHGRVDRCTSSSALRFNAEIMNSCTVIVLLKPWRECYRSIGIRACNKPGSSRRFAASVRAGMALYSP